MHHKPDKNTQASAAAETSVPIESEAVAAGVTPEAADPAPDLTALLRKAEDEAAALKDAWLRAKAETDNVRKQAQNDVQHNGEDDGENERDG
jgi:molecular chaperone GrpE